MDKKKIRKALWWMEDKNITHLSLETLKVNMTQVLTRVLHYILTCFITLKTPRDKLKF